MLGADRHGELLALSLNLHRMLLKRDRIVLKGHPCHHLGWVGPTHVVSAQRGKRLNLRWPGPYNGIGTAMAP